MVPDPLMQTTRAIDIEASRAEVWPWLAQMGYGRAGWYSYDPLEKIAGPGEFAEVRSADRILPQFQDLRVGDLLPVAPDVGWFTAASVDPHRCLALRATMNPLTGKAIATTEPMSEPWFDASWVFLLQEPVAGMTRLGGPIPRQVRPQVVGSSPRPCRPGAGPLRDGSEDAAGDQGAGREDQARRVDGR